MKNVSVILFTEDSGKFSSLIRMLNDISNLTVCSYDSDSWENADLYSPKNALFIFDKVPETADADWIILKLFNDGIFDSVPVMFTSEDVLFSFEKNGYTAAICDVLKEKDNIFLLKCRVENIFEIFNLKQQIQNVTKIHTARILNQASKLKEQDNKLHAMNHELIEVLVAAIESRDLESGQHIKRIRYFAKTLTEIVSSECPEYNITKDVADYIYYASSVHDIGKIAIPDSILLKPSKLSKTEFEIMKTHTTRGVKLLGMLDGVNTNDSEYFRFCKDICLYHHERWDGRGYPFGKKGDDIPISAQIVSVCDCYDALTSERPYKKPFSHDEAVEMIIDGCCGVFSPQIIKCFNMALPEFKRIGEEFKDIGSFEDVFSSDFYDIQNNIVFTEENFNADREEYEKILKSLGVVFEADLTKNSLTIISGDMTEFFINEPRNYQELLNFCKNVSVPSEVSLFTRELTADNLSLHYSKGRNKTKIEFKLLSGRTERVVSGFLKLKGEDGVLIGISGFFDSVDTDDCFSVSARHLSDSEKKNDLISEKSFINNLERLLSNPDNKGMFVYIDIDDLGIINNVFGYEFGNELISEFSFKLKSLTNDNILVARSESDKFILYYNNIKSQSEAVIFVQNLHNLLKKQYRTPNENWTFSVTMGISRFPVNGNNYKQLSVAARYAARAAKISGKGTYSFFNENMRTSAEFNLADLGLNNEVNDVYESSFVPIADFSSDKILTYDFLPSGDEELRLTPEAFYELYKDSNTGKNISMLYLKTILYILSGLKRNGSVMPPISVYTLFMPDSFSGLIKDLKEYTTENDCEGFDVCILFPQDILENATEQKINSFAFALKELGFKIGLYLVGGRYIHNSCYNNQIFDRYVLSSEFYENSLLTGKTQQMILNEFNLLKNSVPSVSVSDTVLSVFSDSFGEEGLSGVFRSLNELSGTEALIKDFTEKNG